MKTYHLALFICLACLLAGCAIFGGNDTSEHDRNRRLWEAQGLQDYDYTLNTSCFCPYFGPIRVEIREGALARATLLTQTDSTFNDPGAFVKTIAALFDIIETARSDADMLDVTYDPDLGYPARIDIDYYRDAVDDEVTYQVYDFQPVSL